MHKIIIRSCKTGKIIDECIPDEVPDAALHRWMTKPEDIRVELVMKDAAKMFEKVGPDVSEIFSQPRVAQEAVIGSYDGVRLSPGWSLDLTRNDPLTGEPWDLSKRKVRERVRDLIRTTQPSLIIGSPPCTMFTMLQNLSEKWRREDTNKQAEFDRNLKVAKRA